MKVLIITAKGYDDYELFYPYYRLQEEGIDVDIAAEEKGTIKGVHLTMEANKGYNSICPSEYQGLILPGGGAPEIVRLYPKAIEIVKYFINMGLPIAAICHGQQILITADALQGKSCTCYESIKDDVVNAGANYLDQPIVTDENLITSRCPQDLPCFMKAFLSKLKS